MSFGETIAQILSLFIIMVVGYIMSKRGIIDDAANVRYTRLVLNISLPAQILTVFASNQGIVSNKEVLIVFGISLLMYLIYAIIGIVFLFVTRVKAEQKGTYLFMMLFGNVVFMGLPVVEGILGEEALIYVVIFNVIFNLLVFSLGIILIGKREKGVQFDIKKLINMPLISSLVSIFMYFANIKLPNTLMRSLEFMGDMTTPVAMLILGSIIANMNFKELFDEWRIYLFIVVKLVVLPVVALFVMKYMPIQSEIISGCMILLSAMPVATNATMLALEYDGDVKLASKGIFFTTIFCMISIPIITAIY